MTDADPGADPSTPRSSDPAPQAGQPLPAWQPASKPASQTDLGEAAKQAGQPLPAWQPAPQAASPLPGVASGAPPRASRTKKYVVGAGVILAVGSVAVIALFTPKLTAGQKSYVAYVTAKGVRPPDLDDDLVAAQGQAFCDQIKKEGIDRAVSPMVSAREDLRAGRTDAAEEAAYEKLELPRYAAAVVAICPEYKDAMNEALKRRPE